MSASPAPALSLILCSRNDSYMGNSRWRLETTINYVAEQVEALQRTDDVEILVADWGSEVPLHDVVALGSAAERLTSFLWIPPALARELQRDSPFPEVLALNAAARRAHGEFIGRIDQDTLAGRRFLEVFFDFYEGRRRLHVPLKDALLYANRREIPYRFAVRCPSYSAVAEFVRRFGRWLPVRRMPNRPFWTYWVGIWLAHRTLWHESGGYDERLLYYNWMEVDMIARLAQTRDIVDLGAVVDYGFFHLEHADPRVGGPRHDLKNASMDKLYRSPRASQQLNPNGEGWGLAGCSLVRSPMSERATTRPAAGIGPATPFPRLVVLAPAILVDELIVAARSMTKRIEKLGRRRIRRIAADARRLRGRVLRFWRPSLKARIADGSTAANRGSS